jgi:tetratricopeptide (TPR) repeat protein
LSKKKIKKSTNNLKQTATQINGTINHQSWVKKNLQVLFYLGIIAIVTAIIFSPSLDNGFITNWDDADYVVKNPDIRELNFHNIATIFSSTYVSNYQPLTMLSYMVDFQFFQLNPMAFHFTNVVWHIANCLLVFLLIYTLSGSNLASLIAALLFAIHPLRVESVAWVAERKDVMSAFFYFLSLLFYIRYLKLPGKSLYYLGIFSFLFSLLCKPMAVSLPIVLLLIYYLKNGRPDKKAIMNTIPFFAIAAVFSVITLFAQNVLAPVGTDTFSLSILNRLCIPFYGIVFYIVKTVIPFRLCSFYPFPGNAEYPFMIIISPLIVAGLMGLLYYFRSHSRKLLFGLLFYFFTLLPVLQIIPVGNAMVADRYSYIPGVGICFLVASFFLFVKDKFRTRKSLQMALSAGMGLLIIIFCCLSFNRCSVWKDSLTLWNDVVSKYSVDAAYYFRGLAYAEQGNYPMAISDYNQAIEKNHEYALALDARGTALFNVGQYDKALEDYSEAIRIIPKNAISYANRGTLYSQKGDFQKAIADYSEAIKIYPNGAFASFCNRGMAYGHLGDYNNAIDDFSQAINLNPGYGQVYYYRALAYQAKGENGLAIDDMKTSCNLGFDQACKAMYGNGNYGQ